MRTKWLKIIIVLAAAALTLGGVRLTMSYLTEKSSLTNTFTVGDLKLGMKEPDWDPEDGDGDNVYPGYSVYKNPTIKNITSSKNGEEPCYARMRILLQDSKGNMITDAGRIALIKTMIRYDSTYTGDYAKGGAGKNIVQGRIPGYAVSEVEKLPMVNPVFTLDEARSSENEFVYRYMGENGKGILNIGDEATLFTALIVPIEWTHTEIDLLGDFRIVIQAEAIQASGFADQDSAFDALDAQVSAQAKQDQGA